MHHPAGTTARRRLLRWSVALVILAVAAIAWTTTPARDLIAPERLVDLAETFRGHPAAPWIVLGGFVVGGFLALPVTLMVVIAVATFGAVPGFLWALGGATLSATLSFLIGRRLGHRDVERLAGSRLHALSRRLRDAGITSIAALRMMPVTHFTVVSLIAGASHIRLRDFVAGTMIGMAPGIGAIALLFDRFAVAAREPEPRHFLGLALASLGILAALLTIRRLVRKQ